MENCVEHFVYEHLYFTNTFFNYNYASIYHIIIIVIVNNCSSIYILAFSLKATSYIFYFTNKIIHNPSKYVQYMLQKGENL